MFKHCTRVYVARHALFFQHERFATQSLMPDGASVSIDIISDAETAIVRKLIKQFNKWRSGYLNQPQRRRLC
jgi:hypothetical protein